MVRGAGGERGILGAQLGSVPVRGLEVVAEDLVVLADAIAGRCSSQSA